MAAKWVDLLRVRITRYPSVEHAITRPNISFVHVAAGWVRIRDSGGQSPSVIFACDAPNVVEHYDEIFKLLSSDYRLICFELPGFGFSRPSPNFDFSLQQYVLAAADIITNLNASPATLVFPCGSSYIAMKLAAEQPALVDRLVITQCPHWREEWDWTRRIDQHGLIHTPIIGQLFMALAPQRVSDTWYKVALPAGQPTRRFSEPARKALFNGGIFCLASLIQTWFRDSVQTFTPVSQPTIVMWGGSDRTHSHSDRFSVLEYLQHGKVLVYHDAGHFVELEDPQRLKDILSNKELWDNLAERLAHQTGEEEQCGAREASVNKGHGTNISNSPRSSSHPGQGSAFAGRSLI